MGLEYFGGPRTLNGLTVESQTFEISSSGTDFGITSDSGVHTFDLPSASATARGLVTTGSQTFAGEKTFSGDVLFTDATYDIGKSGATRPRDGFFSRNLTSGGTVRATGSSVYSPAFKFAGHNSGFWEASASRIYLGLNGNVMYDFNSGNLIINNSAFGIAGGSVDTNNADVLWVRDSAGVWASRNGTNAQTLSIYRTFTSDTSFECLRIKGTSGGPFIFAADVGSAGGTVRGMRFGNYTAADATNLNLWFEYFPSSSSWVVYGGFNVNQRYGDNTTASQTTLRKARGTASSPTAVLNNDNLAIFSGAGYKATAFSGAVAYMSVIATENYTDTATGAKICFFTIPNGSTTPLERMSIDHGGVITVVEGLKTTKGIFQTSEVTSTPTGTTQTITLANSNHQTLSLTSATGNVTATLTIPSGPSSGTIVVRQHASAVKDITWAVSSGSIKWMGTEPTWSSDAVSDVRVVSWRWDGSVMYLVSTDVGT